MSDDINVLGQPIGRPVPDWTAPPLPPRDSREGRFCRIEPLHVHHHARELYDANALDTDGRMWTYLPYGPFGTYEEYHAWLAARVDGRDPAFFAIVDLATDRAIGTAVYQRIDLANGVIEVGQLAFSPLLQGTVASTEAMYLMMEWAFALGYRRYEWRCNSLNARSRSAAQRLGLSFEGIFRQGGVVKGRNRDTAWYAAIDQDWPALRVAFQNWLAPANFDVDGRQRTRLSDATGPLLARRG